MEYQEFIKLLEDMKKAGCYYNDADFCRKMNIASSRLSMMKTGQRPKEETEELLKIEAREAPNKICLKCSRFIDINNVQYAIFKYLGRYTILKNH